MRNGARRRPAIEPFESRELLNAPGAAPSLGPPPAPGPDVIWVDTVARLQDATRNLRSNQTIVIQPGTYDLTRTLFIGGNGQVSNVTIRGATDDFRDVVIRGRGMENPDYGSVPHGIAVYDAQDVTIANLSVGEAYFHPIDLQGGLGAERVHLYHVRAFDGGQQIIKSNPGNGGVNDSSIRYSLIEYTAGPPTIDSGGGTGYSGGLHAHDADRWVIRHNTWRNFHTPDEVEFWYNPVILMWNHSSDTIVEGNTFINCDRAVAFGLIDRPGNDHEGGIIRNNVIYQEPGLFSAARRAGSDAQILVYDSPGTKVDHNTILTNGNSRLSIEVRWATTGVEFRNNLADAPLGVRNGGVFSGSGNYLDATPSMFVDPADANLGLVKNDATLSFVIDRVDPIDGVADDWAGDPRPIGIRADVGADEYRFAGPSPGDGGFERPAVGSGDYGSFRYGPSGTAWSFAGGAGVSGDGSGFTAGNPPAPEGGQVAFLQQDGSFSQAVHGWLAATYRIRFQAAQRANHQTGGDHDFQVLVGGREIGRFRPAGTTYSSYATAAFAVEPGTHAITFRGLNTAGGDNTSFLDAIVIERLAGFHDGGFERPAVGSGDYGSFRYGPSGTAWSFAGGAGVSGDGSGFTAGNPPAPEGGQVAFLQQDGSFSQAVHGWAEGWYVLDFAAAQRGNHQEGGYHDFDVLVDGVVVGTFRPTDTTYRRHVAQAFHVGPGSHRITFRGRNGAGGDNTSLLDDLRVLPA